jgi:glycosyltransferase involved in cell wall biosynthesis
MEYGLIERSKFHIPNSTFHPMRIIHISCVAPPEIGGIGQSAFEMVKGLRSCGHDAVLVSRQIRHALPEPDAEFVKRLPSPLRWGNAGVLSGLKPLMKTADVVQLHYPFFGTAEAVAQDCLLLKKPLVTTFHMDATAPFPIGMAFAAYRSMVQPAVLLASHRVFVSSLDYADHSSLRGFRKSHPERVVELPFGVDHEFFMPRPEGQRARGPEGTETLSASGHPAFWPSGLSPAHVIGFVGGMDGAHAFKGIPVLLKAMTLLPSDCHALLVGDGARRRVFEAKARDLGIAGRCHFTGRLDQQKLREAYCAMDVLALPSTSAAEAFGLVAVEAMSCGVPVVASNLPGVRSVVNDRVTGLLTPPGDAAALAGALKELVTNETLRQGYGRAGRERVLSRYDWRRHVDGLVRAYREVTGMS